MPMNVNRVHPLGPPLPNTVTSPGGRELNNHDTENHDAEGALATAAPASLILPDPEPAMVPLVQPLPPFPLLRLLPPRPEGAEAWRAPRPKGAEAWAASAAAHAVGEPGFTPIRRGGDSRRRARSITEKSINSVEIFMER